MHHPRGRRPTATRRKRPALRAKNKRPARPCGDEERALAGRHAVPAARALRHRDQRLPAAHRRVRRPDRCHSKLPRRQRQPSAVGLSDEHGQHPHGTPEPRQLVELRSGQREPRHAGLRRPARSGRRAQRRLAGLEQRLSAGGPSGHAPAPWRGSHPQPRAAPVASRRHAARRARSYPGAQSRPSRGARYGIGEQDTDEFGTRCLRPPSTRCSPRSPRTRRGRVASPMSIPTDAFSLVGRRGVWKPRPSAMPCSRSRVVSVAAPAVPASWRRCRRRFASRSARITGP